MLYFFNDTATTEIYTLSLHDALPILPRAVRSRGRGRALPRGAERPALRLRQPRLLGAVLQRQRARPRGPRSEEHTSELQSRQYLVCRLLLETKRRSCPPPVVRQKFAG